jgi:hypothetical protein
MSFGGEKIGSRRGNALLSLLKALNGGKDGQYIVQITSFLINLRN